MPPPTLVNLVTTDDAPRRTVLQRHSVVDDQAVLHDATGAERHPGFRKGIRAFTAGVDDTDDIAMGVVSTHRYRFMSCRRSERTRSAVATKPSLIATGYSAGRSIARTSAGSFSSVSSVRSRISSSVGNS